MTTSQRSMAERLLEIAEERGAIRYGDFTLSSGRKSSYYFDGRLLSLDPEGAHLIGNALLSAIDGLDDAGIAAIGGPTLGADPIVAAVAMASWQSAEGGRPLPAFIVRKEAKGYGTAQLIEGPLPARSDRRHRGRCLHHRRLAVPRHRRGGSGRLHGGPGAGGAGPQRGRQRRDTQARLPIRRATDGGRGRADTAGVEKKCHAGNGRRRNPITQK